MSIKNKNGYIRCKWCRFVREDASISDFDWTAYECGNPKSEYHKSLLNVDPQGNKLSNIMWSGCPELTEDKYCDKHRKLESSYYNKYRRDPNTYKRYGKRWRKIRQLYIKEHPVCELCERKNILRPVEEVHHIVPLSKGGTHHKENLMSLCKSCHSRITARDGGRWE